MKDYALITRRVGGQDDYLSIERFNAGHDECPVSIEISVGRDTLAFDVSPSEARELAAALTKAAEEAGE